jgi:hypothetical protein
MGETSSQDVRPLRMLKKALLIRRIPAHHAPFPMLPSRPIEIFNVPIKFMELRSIGAGFPFARSIILAKAPTNCGRYLLRFQLSADLLKGLLSI